MSSPSDNAHTHDSAHHANLITCREMNGASLAISLILSVFLSITMSGSMTLVSCWSKAGVGTSIVLEYTTGGKKRPRVVLDCGATPIFNDCIRASTILISHSHLDHIGAIFSHARAHSVVCSGYVRCDQVYGRSFFLIHAFSSCSLLLPIIGLFQHIMYQK